MLIDHACCSVGAKSSASSSPDEDQENPQRRKVARTRSPRKSTHRHLPPVDFSLSFLDFRSIYPSRHDALQYW
jgi:hypothetical protein